MRLTIGRGTVWDAWDSAGRHCKPRPGESHWCRGKQWQTDAGRLREGCAAGYWLSPYDWPSPSWRRMMRCMLLHRQRGSGHGYGPAAAPWAAKLQRGRRRLGRCTGRHPGPMPRPGPTPRGWCNARPTRQEGMSVAAVETSHSGSAPETRKPRAEPGEKSVNKHRHERREQFVGLNKPDSVAVIKLSSHSKLSKYLFTPISIEAVVTFSKAHGYSSVSWRERIPHTDAHGSHGLECKKQTSKEPAEEQQHVSILLVWCHQSVWKILKSNLCQNSDVNGTTLAWIQDSREATMSILAKNMALKLLFSGQSRLQHLPETWIMLHKQYRDMLSFSSVVFFNGGVLGHHRFSFGGIFPLCEIQECLCGLENLTRVFLTSSRTWVNFQLWVNYDFKNSPPAPGTSLTWLRFKGRSVLSPELQGCRLEDLFGFM